MSMQGSLRCGVSTLAKSSCHKVEWAARSSVGPLLCLPSLPESYQCHGNFPDKSLLLNWYWIKYLPHSIISISLALPIDSNCYTAETRPDRFAETWVYAHRLPWYCVVFGECGKWDVELNLMTLTFPSALKRIPTFGNALFLPKEPVLHQLSEKFPISTTSVPSSTKAEGLNKKCSFYDKDTY